MNQTLKIGLVSISDRASQGVYEDKGLPALRDWLKRTVTTPLEFEARLIADEQDEIQSTLIDLVDYQGCQLVLTTGGTGPAPRGHASGIRPTGRARPWCRSPARAASARRNADASRSRPTHSA